MKIYYYTPIHAQMKSEGVKIGSPYIIVDENTILKNLAPIQKLQRSQHLDIFKDDNNNNLNGNKTLSENHLYDGATVYIGPGTIEKFYIQPVAADIEALASGSQSIVSDSGPKYTVASTVLDEVNDDDILVQAEPTNDYAQQATRIDNGNQGLGHWGDVNPIRLTNPDKEGGKRKKRNSRKISRKKLRKSSRKASRKGKKSKRKYRSHK